MPVVFNPRDAFSVFGLASLDQFVDLLWNGGAMVAVGSSFDYSINAGALSRFAGYQYTAMGVAELDPVNRKVPLLVTGNEAWSAAKGAVITGGGGADTVVWLGGPAIVDGGLGNDTIVTGGGDDLVFGGDGKDVLSTNGGNDIVFGGNGDDIVTGGAGNDLLHGEAGNDILNGGAGDDTLDGGAGGDAMTGGAGNDTYFVDSSADRITEGAGGGTDQVVASVSYSLLTIAQVENLTLVGGALQGYGNALNNLIIGNAQDNVLIGYGGEDTLAGGAGNDTYTIDSLGDRVVEQAGGGIDTVQSTISFDLNTTPFVEHLRLLGTAASAIGNALDNCLDGSGGNNLLQGGEGNDTLRGNGGRDTLVGGAGNDTYLIHDADDSIAELPGGGTDTVRSSISFSLASLPEVENLVLQERDTTLGMGAVQTGIDLFAWSDAINGTGNGRDNLLLGNVRANLLSGLDGDDTLDGGLGNDTLVGGNGRDVFGFDLGGGADVVMDFTGGQDRIRLYGFGLPSFAQLQPLLHQQGADVLVDLGHGDTLLLRQASLGGLKAADFLFG